MTTISINYALHFELSFAPNYKWTKCGKCFNTKTGRQIKKVLQGRCIGYRIDGKFYSLTFLRRKLQRITQPICPF